MAAEKVGVAGLGHERQRGERVVVAGEGGEEMNGVRDGKQAVAVGGGQFHRWGGDAVPLKRRRVGLMSNGAGDDDDDDAGAGVSDERGDDEGDYDDEEEEVGQELEEEEEREEGEADELSVGEDDEVGLEVERADVEEDEDEVYEEVNPEEEGVDDDLLVEAPMDRNGGHRGRAMAYEEAEMEVEEVEEEEEEEEEQEEEEEEEGYEEDAPVVPDSPPMRVRVGGGRERSRDAFEGASDGSQERRAAMMIAPPRGFAPERGQSSSGEPPRHRETVSKVAAVAAAAPKVRGMVDTAPKKKKAKVAEVPAVVAVPAPLLPPLDHRHPHRNGGESKPKKEKAPAAAPPPLPPPSSAAVPKRKPSAAADALLLSLPPAPHPPQPRDRGRFASDNKARVTLERAREILAAVKAAMVKDPKRFSSRQPVEPPRHVVENTSSSDYDESASPLQQQQPPPSRVANQHHQRHLQMAVKAEASAPKKRSRPSSKGEKDPASRSRKPKAEAAGYQLQAAAADDKALYRSRAFVGNDDSYKSVARIAAAAGDDREAYERKQFVEDNGYERQTTVVEKKVRKRKKGKDLDGMFGEPTLVPGSILRDESWTPPSSPFGLIQESLYTDPWKVLLSCMLLNKSAGRQFLVQMHKVIWDLFSLCPDAETAINMDTGKIAEKVYSLGLQNKRAKMIQRFSLEYVRGDWTNVTQLHGIGKYAADAYAIFCQGLWRDVEPDDHMLSKYWKWLCDTDGLGAAFTPDMV